MLLQVKNLTFSRGTKLLFADLSLAITAGDRIGLVGHNGCGKTSLLSLLSGQAQADAGERIARRGLNVGVMEQFIPVSLQSRSLLDVTLDALPRDTHSTDTWRAEAILAQLGFHPHQFAVPLAQLSGGQQNLALFARAQLKSPELLLMDEPGNHMDVLALHSLKTYLHSTRDLTFVMISHDRELLDECCDSTVFLRDQRAYHFSLPYSQAKAALAEQDEQAEHRRNIEQKEIDRIRASAKRLAQWGRTYDNEDLARKAKTMVLRADKLADQQTFVSQGSGLALELEGAALHSKTVFTFENLHVQAADDGRELLTCDYLVAKPGERIALLGANGCGKSTTIRQLLAAQQADKPGIRFNPQVSVGYFDQELAGFDTDIGRYDWLAQQVDCNAGAIKKILLHAGIAYADFGQPVNSLSGGEKARLVFMLLSLQQPSLMILDEPTNHIDLESREQLEQQLIDANTTLLITSHDRQFLQHVCSRFWLIRDGRLREVEYLQQYYDSLHPEPAAATRPTPPPAHDTVSVADDSRILDRIQQLEDLLAADRARKPKFQKPERQAAWQQELEHLWAQV